MAGRYGTGGFAFAVTVLCMAFSPVSKNGTLNHPASQIIIDYSTDVPSLAPMNDTLSYGIHNSTTIFDNPSATEVLRVDHAFLLAILAVCLTSLNCFSAIFSSVRKLFSLNASLLIMLVLDTLAPHLLAALLGPAILDKLPGLEAALPTLLALALSAIRKAQSPEGRLLKAEVAAADMARERDEALSKRLSAEQKARLDAFDFEANLNLQALKLQRRLVRETKAAVQSREVADQAVVNCREDCKNMLGIRLQNECLEHQNRDWEAEGRALRFRIERLESAARRRDGDVMQLHQTVNDERTETWRWRASHGIVLTKKSKIEGRAREMYLAHDVAIAEKDAEIKRLKVCEEGMRLRVQELMTDHETLAARHEQHRSERLILRSDIKALERERRDIILGADQELQHAKKSAEAAKIVENIQQLSTLVPATTPATESDKIVYSGQQTPAEAAGQTMNDLLKEHERLKDVAQEAETKWANLDAEWKTQLSNSPLSPQENSDIAGRLAGQVVTLGCGVMIRDDQIEAYKRDLEKAKINFSMMKTQMERAMRPQPASASNALVNVTAGDRNQPHEKPKNFQFGQSSTVKAAGRTTDNLIKDVEQAKLDLKTANNANSTLENEKMKLSAEVVLLENHVQSKNMAEKMNRETLHGLQEQVEQLNAAAKKDEKAYKDSATETSNEVTTGDAAAGHGSNKLLTTDAEKQTLWCANAQAALLLRKLVTRIEKLQNIQLPDWVFPLEQDELDQMQRDVEDAAKYELPFGVYGGADECQHTNRKNNAKNQKLCADCYNAKHPTKYKAQLPTMGPADDPGL
ncbi:hypothetical protein LTR36_007452 [Oleoguttula mirabilis]|uniref:Uncharacterized protein n=1 Tax=Oleoguttula mirabilis TaxID=1507867 RepID=A0AAV9J9Y8_9PEZI|nr:hypothetical protein LTR36_007452 [Oleoguttula mirabilis]